ncbi:MAG: hypothetical protein V3V82_03790 [Acidimicrobiia bacterium]
MAGGQWAVAGDGGYLGHSQLSKQIRDQVQGMGRLDQFAVPIDKSKTIGRGNGDTVLFDRMDLITDAAGKVSETDTIPESEMPVTQGSLVISEWGIKIPFTGRLEALAQFSPSNIYHRGLIKSQVKAFDLECATLLRTGKIVYSMTGTAGAGAGTWSYDGTDPVTATRDLDLGDIRALVEKAKSLHIEPMDDDGNYVAVIPPGGVRAIQNDSEWRDAQNYNRTGRIFNGEIGEAYGARFVEENLTMLNVINAGNDKSELFLLGRDALAKGIVIAPEIRSDTPTDLGRHKTVGWYGMVGYALVWNDHTATEAGADGKARFLRVESAAS